MKHCIIKGLILHIAAIANAMALNCSCSHEYTAHDTAVRQNIDIDCGTIHTKSSRADEDAVWDLNIFVTGEGGIAEYHEYKSFSRAEYGQIHFSVDLLKDREYDITAITNAGYDMGTMSLDELAAEEFHLSRPDEFSHGMPMCGRATAFRPDDGATLKMNMERLVSKVSVILDRSRLDKDIGFNIAGVKVGNCPRYAKYFPPSAIKSGTDIFQAGYYADGSDRTELYLMENLQGRLNKELCSYIELDIDYDSYYYYTKGGRSLKYRFYLREGNSYMVQRNCHYTVTICPEKDGLLCEDSWRVDKSALIEKDGTAYLHILPKGTVVDGTLYENYFQMSTGESRHFDLAYYPADMKVILRQDLVDEEKSSGRAIYTMDTGGKGFTIQALDKACLSMMEIFAGEPLNDSRTIAVEISAP